MKNFEHKTVDLTVDRVELHDILGLSGAEVTINNLPAGVSVPFVHAHTHNEELYVVLAGKGMFFIDGEEFALHAGSVVRVVPAAQRCIKADDASAMRFICIQTREGSLQGFTANDAVVSEEFAKPSWL